MDLADYLVAGFVDPCMHMNIWNNQTWQFACGNANPDNKTVDDISGSKPLRVDKEHLGEFLLVGFTATFEADSARVFNALGLPNVKVMPKKNTNPGRPRASEQPTAVRNMLDRLTELYLELYDYAWKELSAAKQAERRGKWPW